jgi:hypothetical protein
VARFIGGPCAGQSAPSVPQPFRDCGGATYGLLEDGNYHFLGGSTADTFATKQIGRAWHRLMNVYAVEAPASLRRARAARARIRRMAR